MAEIGAARTTADAAEALQKIPLALTHSTPAARLHVKHTEATQTRLQSLPDYEHLGRRRCPAMLLKTLPDLSICNAAGAGAGGGGAAGAAASRSSRLARL